MRRWLPAWLVLVGLAFGAMWSFVDGPLVDEATTPRPGAAPRVAAVAIRDHVIPFQKFGTKLFTLPTLHLGYDQVTYLTENHHAEQRDGFVRAIEAAAATHDWVDLWILAHANWVVGWLWDLSPQAVQKLRLVYNTGCDNAYQADAWHDRGARTYVGHPGRTSVSPVFYVFFARRWVRGWTAEDAARDANEQTRRRLRIFGWLTFGVFDGTTLADETTGIVTGVPGVRVR